MKKAVAFLLALLILLPTFPAARADVAGYADVAEGDWFAQAVSFVTRYGLMNGTGEAQFSPYDTVTRGMAATILYRMEGEPETEGDPFVDVPAGKWYSDAIAWAGNEGIVNGVGNGKFDPEGGVTRQQLVAILYRYVMWKGWDIPVDGYEYCGMIPDPDTGGMTERVFSDGWRVSEYARVPMVWAVNRGVFFSGQDSGETEMEIDPEARVIRAELAATLKNLYDNVINAEGEPGRELLSSGLYESEDGGKQVHVGAIHKDGAFSLSIRWVRAWDVSVIANIAGSRAAFDDGKAAGYVDFFPDRTLTVVVTRGYEELVGTGETFTAAFVTARLEEQTERAADGLLQDDGYVWYHRNEDTNTARFVTFGPDNTLEIVAAANGSSDGGTAKITRSKLNYTSDGFDIFTVGGKKYQMEAENTGVSWLHITPLEDDLYGLGGDYLMESAEETGFTKLKFDECGNELLPHS